MKKTVLSVFALCAMLTLFSFNKVDNSAPNFKELIDAPVGGGSAGKFTRYERSGTTSDKSS